MRRIPAEQLTAIARRLLKAAGAGDDETEVVVEELIETSLIGLDSHGIIRVPQYVRQLRAGSIRPGANPRIIKKTGNTLIIDGCNGLGMITARFMTE